MCATVTKMSEDEEEVKVGDWLKLKSQEELVAANEGKKRSAPPCNPGAIGVVLKPARNLPSKAFIVRPLCVCMVAITPDQECSMAENDMHGKIWYEGEYAKATETDLLQARIIHGPKKDPF